MNIAPIVQGFSVQSSHSGNNLPQTEKVSLADTSENIGKSSKQVDLRDVSINEINALIKSGNTELLDVVPFIPPHILKQYNYDAESIGNHRVDLLGQVEKSIDFKKSIGENTRLLDAVLENLKNIDGSYDKNSYSKSGTIQLPYPTDDTCVIVRYARFAIEKLYKPGYAFLKSGVGLIDIADKEFFQTDLFCEGQSVKTDSLMALLDKVNRKYGKGTLYTAAEGIQKKWAMQQNYRSASFTTSWSNLPIICCS